MINQIYDIKNKIKESKILDSNPVVKFETDILDKCPIESNCLYPGKLYIFNYHLGKTKKLYDSRPYIMSLGYSDNDPTMFFGIGMHNIPYSMRVQIFAYIYNNFKSIINREILNFSEPETAQRQKYIIEMTSENVLRFPVMLKPAIKKYNIKFISSCKVINYNLIHYMLQSDENFFVNGSIADAQKQFLK